jgi:hypothetical protein
MSNYLNHPDFYNQPVCLSEDQILDPIQVLREFFTDYNLSELRQINADIKEHCLTTDRVPFSEPENRENHILYQEKLIGLLEAASILAR